MSAACGDRWRHQVPNADFHSRRAAHGTHPQPQGGKVHTGDGKAGGQAQRAEDRGESGASRRGVGGNALSSVCRALGARRKGPASAPGRRCSRERGREAAGRGEATVPGRGSGRPLGDRPPSLHETAVLPWVGRPDRPPSLWPVTETPSNWPRTRAWFLFVLCFQNLF